MCALALLTWFATMISEYGKLFHFALGLSEVWVPENWGTSFEGPWNKDPTIWRS